MSVEKIKIGNTEHDIYAARSTADASGNIITSTYATKSELNTAKSNLQASIDGKSDKTHTHNYAGSSSVGGSATSAVKLDTSAAGSATQPVYFSNGKPVATTYSLNKTVPADAKFTDTTYATATTSADGLMSSTDKKRVNSLAGDTYLGGFVDKTIVDLQNAFDNWLASNSSIVNATAKFSVSEDWVSAWNSDDKSKILKAGGTWTVTNIAPYKTNEYAQLRISYYVDELVYYVTKYDGKWKMVHQTAFKDDLDAKQNKITGAATTITDSNLTANRALVSNASGKVAVSDITSTELGYLDGAKSNIQTQLDSVNTIATEAKNVEIGGRNLLRKYLQDGSRTSKIDNLSIKIGSSSTSGDTYFYLKAAQNLKAGTLYTISCDASNVPSGTSWSFAVGSTSNSNFVLCINKNGRCYASGKLNSDVAAGSTILIDDMNGNVAANLNIVLSNFKLERGGKATDYTPSVEDIQESIDNKLPLSGGTITGIMDLTSYPNANDGYKMGMTNGASGGVHFKKSSGENDKGNAITWSHSGNEAHAGIYVKTSGAYGSKMYLATTNLFADGAKAALEIDYMGNITALRGKFIGNLTGNATSATIATQDSNKNDIVSTYETKSAASSKLTEAKTYADNVATTAANKVKNDLLNGAGGAYDTLKELGNLIDDNTDAIDALEIVATNKADKIHTHDDRYYTESEINTKLNSKLNTSGGTLTGRLDISRTAADKASPQSQDIVLNCTLPSGTSLTEKNAPGIGFHISGTSWGNLIFDGKFKFVAPYFDGYYPVQASQFIGKLTGNADTASQVHSMVTNPSNGTTYQLPFMATSGSSGNISLLKNDGIGYWTQEGTTSLVGTGELKLGNNIASGTAGNKKGLIYMYGTSSGYTELVPSNNTSSNVVISLPSKAGTIALTTDTVSGATKDGSGNTITSTYATKSELNTAKSTLQSSINSKAPSSHTHNYAGSSSAGGSANSAIKLATARTISLTGDVTGSTSFDGSGNASITATVADDSHNHVISNVDGLQTALNGRVLKRKTTGDAYNSLGTYYGGGSTAKYVKISFPSVPTWTMMTMELTVREDYNSAKYGKLMIYANQSSSAEWNKFFAVYHDTLSSNIKVYASDKKHIYIGGLAAYGGVSLDRMLIGDSAMSSDLTNMTITGVDSLPTTYQTATMKKSFVEGDTLTGNLSGNASTATNVAWSGVTSKPSYYDAKAIKGITRSGTTFTYTCMDGTTGTFTQQDNNTTYSAATSSALGLVKIGSNITNSSGTISLTKANVTAALGYTPPTSDTNTHYTTRIYAGASGTAANASATSPYIKITDDNTYRNQIRLVGGGSTTVKSDGSGNITISSTDTNTTYSAATSSALGLVKIGSNISVSSGTISLTKANVTAALGYTPPTSNTTYNVVTASTNGLVPKFDAVDGTIDSSSSDWVLTNNNGSIGWYKLPANAFNNTTYSAATQSAQGLMSAADKKKLDGIATGANAYSLPTAGSSLGGVKTTSTVTSTSGLTACPIISGVPYYKDTNTTYTSLKNPYSLTIQGNGTTLTNGTYDGSAAKTVNITPSAIGAAASSHTHSYLPLTGGSITGAITINGTNDAKTSPTAQELVINGKVLNSSTNLVPKNAPGIGFHSSNKDWGNFLFDGTFKFMNNNFTDFLPIQTNTVNCTRINLGNSVFTYDSTNKRIIISVT